MKEAERRGYQVLWVDPIGLRSAKLQRKDVAKLTRRLRQLRHPFVRVSDRIWRLAPLGIPLQGTRLGAALNRRALAFQIRRGLRRLGAKRVLLWSYSPHLVRLRQSIDCEAAVYYRTDDYLSAPGVNVSRLRKLEHEAAALADLCVTVNELSLAELPSSTRRRLLVRNGVDLTVFDPAAVAAAAAGAQSDDPTPQVAHPRLLVIGTYDRWFDLDLVRTLMAERRDWSLVLAGESKIDLEALSTLPNVTFLGQVQLERLPALIAGCDIGLVPYLVEPYAVKGSPGKVYQYLAMGVPVLCTPFVDPSVFAGQIAVAPGEPIAFEQAIESLLHADSPELAAARRAFAADQSWAVRFDAIEDELAGILAGEEPGDASTLQPERTGPGFGSAEDDPAQAGEKA
ncbi:MAG: glycosyltransferase [Gaiellaceae bacterium]